MVSAWTGSRGLERRRGALARGGALAGGLLGAAGCGGAEPVAPAGVKAPVTLTYIATTSTERQQGEREVFGRIKEEGAPITVDVSGGGNWDETKQKFLVSAAAGTPIHMAQAGWGGAWLDMWDHGAVVDLAPYFKRDRLSMEATFIDSAIVQWQHGNVIGGLPITTSADALAYNKELFQAAGLRPPPVDPGASWWNMDTFLEYARKLTDRSKNQFGFGGLIAGGNKTGMHNATYFGHRPWDEARKLCVMDSAAWQNAFQFWRDVKFQHRVQPSDQEASEIRGGASGDVFLTGKIGMQVLLVTQAAVPFTWDVATLPYSGPAGSKNISARINNHALIMGQGTAAEREATWQVYRWLLKPENAGRFPRTAGHIVSPLKSPVASEESQRRYREQLGIDPKPYLLQAQGSIAQSGGMSKYARWTSIVDVPLDARYKELMADKLSVREYATWAARFINDNLEAR
jgi:multiple sugar transport system substrate-binding protein